jgi:hypothetical protein
MVVHNALVIKAALTVVKDEVLWGVVCLATQTRIEVGHLAVEQTAYAVVARGASRSTEHKPTANKEQGTEQTARNRVSQSAGMRTIKRLLHRPPVCRKTTEAPTRTRMFLEMSSAFHTL